MLLRIADTTLKLYENIAGAKLRIALRHGKELTAQGIHLLLGIVHLLDAHGAAQFDDLCEQLAFMRHIALGGVQHFGQHIIALCQRNLDAGEALLHTDLFFLEVIDRSDAPEHDGQNCNQKNNYRFYSRFHLSLFLDSTCEKGHIFAKDPRMRSRSAAMVVSVAV